MTAAISKKTGTREQNINTATESPAFRKGTIPGEVQKAGTGSGTVAALSTGSQMPGVPALGDLESLSPRNLLFRLKCGSFPFFLLHFFFFFSETNQKASIKKPEFL